MSNRRLHAPYSEFVTADGHSLRPLDFDLPNRKVLAECTHTRVRRWLDLEDWRHVRALNWLDLVEGCQPEMAAP